METQDVQKGKYKEITPIKMCYPRASKEYRK